MSTIDLRNSVKAYVNLADTRLLKMMKALAETYQNDDAETSLTDEQYNIIDKRREAHLKGKSNSSTWEEVQQDARHSN